MEIGEQELDQVAQSEVSHPRLTHFVETVHIELSHKAMPIVVFEELRQDESAKTLSLRSAHSSLNLSSLPQHHDRALPRPTSQIPTDPDKRIPDHLPPISTIPLLESPDLPTLYAACLQTPPSSLIEILLVKPDVVAVVEQGARKVWREVRKVLKLGYMLLMDD